MLILAYIEGDYSLRTLSDVPVALRELLSYPFAGNALLVCCVFIGALAYRAAKEFFPKRSEK